MRGLTAFLLAIALLYSGGGPVAVPAEAQVSDVYSVLIDSRGDMPIDPPGVRFFTEGAAFIAEGYEDGPEGPLRLYFRSSDVGWPAISIDVRPPLGEPLQEGAYSNAGYSPTDSTAGFSLDATSNCTSATDFTVNELDWTDPYAPEAVDISFTLRCEGHNGSLRGRFRYGASAAPRTQTGTVNLQRAPLSDVTVRAHPATMGAVADTATTDSSGAYTLSLEPGAYHVSFEHPQIADQYLGRHAAKELSELVVVSSSRELADAELFTGSALWGYASSSFGYDPRVMAYLFDQNKELLTRSEGAHLSRRVGPHYVWEHVDVDPGEYRVAIDLLDSEGLPTTEWGATWYPSDPSFTRADAIPVPDKATVRRDVQMLYIAVLSVRLSGTPWIVDQPWVEVWDEDFIFPYTYAYQTFITEDGTSTLDIRVPAGTHHVFAANYDPEERIYYGYFGQWFDDVPVHQWERADPVTVRRAGDVVQLNVDLEPLFADMFDSVFSDDILWMFDTGITTGCGAAGYCPDDSVTRGQMAAFLVRALGLTESDPDIEFSDDDNSVFQADIERLATAGITSGCGPDIFCPDDPVTRGQMAAFLVRAMGYSDQGNTDFTDDNGNVFEADIERLAAAGVTSGCGPTTFCPNDNVTRGQMAAFLHRALGGGVLYPGEAAPGPRVTLPIPVSTTAEARSTKP